MEAGKAHRVHFRDLRHTVASWLGATDVTDRDYGLTQEEA